jgi:hypothetical protein
MARQPEPSPIVVFAGGQIGQDRDDVVIVSVALPGQVPWTEDRCLAQRVAFDADLAGKVDASVLGLRIPRGLLQLKKPQATVVMRPVHQGGKGVGLCPETAEFVWVGDG